MYKKIILAVIAIVFSNAAANAGGVTNIKEVVNRSSRTVQISKYENKMNGESGFRNNYEKTGMIRLRNSWRGDMWIPWADNKEQFRSHFMKIEIIYPNFTSRHNWLHIYATYQTGEEVRSSLERMDQQPNTSDDTEGWWLGERHYNPNAAKVQGEWKSGGERRVAFYDKPDRTVGFKFEKFTR